jgi:hypothetical protein
MKRITVLPASFATVTLLWLYATANSAPVPIPKKIDLDPAVAKAWHKAGAHLGWWERDEFGYRPFSETRPKDGTALPAFFCSEFDAGVIARLPAPSVPFALDLSNSKLTDAGLRELHGFDKLRWWSYSANSLHRIR